MRRSAHTMSDVIRVSLSPEQASGYKQYALSIQRQQRFEDVALRPIVSHRSFSL